MINQIKYNLLINFGEQTKIEDFFQKVICPTIQVIFVNPMYTNLAETITNRSLTSNYSLGINSFHTLKNSSHSFI